MGDERWERWHERFVAKVVARNPQHFVRGESVQQIVCGTSRKLEIAGPLHVISDLFRFVDSLRMLVGWVQPRLVILTDRNLYVVRCGFWRASTIKQVRARYPRGELCSRLRMSSGVVRVNGENVYPTNSMWRKRATRLVDSVGPRSPPAPG